MPHGEFAEGSLGLERTVFTWGDVAALPVGWPGSPGTQVFRNSLVGAGVHTLHTPGLEAIVAAGRCAQGPQADPPVYTASLGPAVLGAHRPAGDGGQMGQRAVRCENNVANLGTAGQLKKFKLSGPVQISSALK